MSTMKCLSCAGVYESVQPDGTRYFHACPEEIPADERRDENIQSSVEPHPGKIRSEGKGATPVV